MGKEIRLFLCIRSPLSGEKVSVLRTLEDAKAQWTHERANCPEVSALLHAGTDRPFFDTFRQVLESNKGYLFLSEAARWLLDEAHAETRVAAASLSAIPGQRSQLLYVGIRGWGYESTFGRIDREAPISGAENVSSGTYSSLIKIIDKNDPFEVARICPPDLVGVALSEIPLTVRCENVLIKKELLTLEQLRGIYLRDALQWANFGRKSAVDLAEALRRFIESRLRLESSQPDRGVEDTTLPEEEKALALPVRAAQEATLLSEIDEFTTTLKPSHQSVLAERILSQKSLEQVGELLGVTRERVRQIESRILDAIAKLEWAKALKERISRLLFGRTEPLFLDLIEVEDPWFAGWSMRARELSNLISALPSDLRVLRAQNRIIVSRISAERFERVLKNTLDFLAQQVREDWSRGDVDLFIEGALRSERAYDLAGLTKELLLPELNFSRTRGEDKEVLRSVGSKLNEVIMAILASAEAPLHYSEIAAAVSERTGRDLSVHNVHARLPRTSALFFGRGRYGVEAHYPISADVELELVDLLKEIMLVDPQRQWHAAELVDDLDARGVDLPDVLDKYILNILMSRAKEFQGMGRMVWSLKTSAGIHKRGRIDVIDACVQVLIESGKPLSTREVKERIGRLRGTSDFSCIQPNERLARVAPEKWGLVDRDFGLNKEEREHLLTNLESELERRTIGLHLSELTHFIWKITGPAQEVTDYMLMGLAQTDPRFRLHRGQLIALAKWNEARRPNVRAAISACVNSRVEVTVPEVVAEVTAMVGREIQRGEVTNTLLQLGWRRQGLTETYVVAYDDEEETSDGSLDADFIVT